MLGNQCLFLFGANPAFRCNLFGCQSFRPFHPKRIYTAIGASLQNTAKLKLSLIHTIKLNRQSLEKPKNKIISKQL